MRPLSSIFFQIHATYIATFSITGYIALDWISSFSSMVSPGSSSLSSSFYSTGKLKFFCAFLWGSKYPWGLLSFKENNSVKWRGTYMHYTRMRLVSMQPSQKKVFVCHQSRRQLFSLGLQMCLPKILQPSNLCHSKMHASTNPGTFSFHVEKNRVFGWVGNSCLFDNCSGNLE
jgi:hypothetical protein